MGKRIVLLQALKATPSKLEQALAQIDADEVQQRPFPDQWSPAEVVTHLIDVEGRYLQRLRRVVGEERPYLPSIHPHTDPPIISLTAEQLAKTFAAVRAETLAFLQGLALMDWDKTAVHQTWGTTDLRTLVQRLIDHDSEHLSQIKAAILEENE